MQRIAWIICACLLGGLLLAGVSGGMGAAAETDSTATPGAVAINEIAWGGTAASSADEWIELYNNTATTIVIDGWHLIDDDSMDLVLAGSIFPHGYYLIERTDDNTVSDLAADLVGSFGTGGLSNTGEVMTLTDGTGVVIDVVNSSGGGWPAGSGSPNYYTLERVDPTLPDGDGNWCSNNGVTRNGLDGLGAPINGTPRAPNSCPGFLPDLRIDKIGPNSVASGGLLTYHITISNVGTALAGGIVVTDDLPPLASLVTQTSPYTFTSIGNTLEWRLGGLAAGAMGEITVSARVVSAAAGTLVNVVRVATAGAEAVSSNNVSTWTTTIGSPGVLIEALLYDGYQAGDLDEAIQLVNVGAAAVDLSGWEVCKDAGSGLSCRGLPAAVISPTDRLWLARDAASFALSFGFDPDHELESWLVYGLSNDGDELVLRDGDGRVVDSLVFEWGLTTTPGWNGPAVWPYGLGRSEGQVLSRIPDELTGMPITDTDSAIDWIQSTAEPARGRRVLYPGWNLEQLFWPLSATETATVVVGIAPDNAFDVVSQTIARASSSIAVEVYSLRHSGVITALVQKAREGVSVTVLLEGTQVGVGMDDPRWQQELWGCQQLEGAGGACWFMIHNTAQDVFNRYDYLHAKFAVVDDEWLLLGSQNLTSSSLPDDDKSNGTYGSRGVVLATNAPAIVARAAEVLRLDLDPANHSDLLRWSPALTGTYGPPLPGYTPSITATDWVTSPVRFPDPLEVSGTIGFELLTAPEAALRQSDGLLGLVGRAGAGDEVYVEQLYEHVDWGADPVGDPNLRLEAYIAAARRGATVRILLNGGWFGQDYYQNTNTATVAYVNQIARAEGLDLAAALGDPTLYGIHNKMVLVWLEPGEGYAHIGSINGSESSSKINREMALQVGSVQVYDFLREMFERDWQWSRPTYLPLVVRDHIGVADHLLLSEVYYWGWCEWVEVYNPTPSAVDLTGYGIGDAQTPERYEGMYRFPHQLLGPGEVLLVAGDASECTAFVPDYELFGAHAGVPNLTRDPVWGDGEFGLGNIGDEVVLVDGAGLVVDAVVYGAGSYVGVVPHPGVESGQSLERVPANTDRDDCSRDFQAGWSPGLVW